MAILTHIKGIPLFTTPVEAIAWGRKYGLTGYHTHMHNVRTGYMGGTNHHKARKLYNTAAAQYSQSTSQTPTPIPPPIPPPPTQPQPQQQSSPTPPPPPQQTGGGGGGY